MDTGQAQAALERSARAAEMLRAVIDGRTYEAVAAQFGITRTAVERRVKALAARLSREVGVNGLNEDAAAFVRRLRLHRDALLLALERFDPTPNTDIQPARVVTTDEIAKAVMRIRGRSNEPARDVALFYILFATGARPLEIARLQVRDYLHEDGSVRRESVLPPEATITGKPRPLYFASSKLVEALDDYLRRRAARDTDSEGRSGYRRLDPSSRLFLASSGLGFQITPYGKPGQHRFLCRPILETYRKLFRYAELDGTTPLSVRRTLVARLYERGADEEQVGLVLGISERSAVRELYPRSKPTMSSLVEELV